MTNVILSMDDNLPEKKGLRILVIGDPHFQVRNIPEVKVFISKIISLAQKHQPDFIVCLGDILHRYETIHVKPFMCAGDFLVSLSQIAKTYLLIGNHDRPNNFNFLTNEHPFNAFKQYPNLIIVDEVVTSFFNQEQFMFVPYVETGRFEEALKTSVHDFQKAKIIFAHQEFCGAKFKAIRSKNGDNWPLSYPLVISGHIHDYEKLQSNIIYVGSSIQQGYGDSPSKTISFFDVTAQECQEYRINPGLIQKVQFHLSFEEFLNFIPAPNQKIKLIVQASDSEMKQLMNSDQVREFKSLGILIEYKAYPKSNPYPNLNQIRLSYAQRLHQTISSDTLQLKWYDHLFGSQS